MTVCFCCQLSQVFGFCTRPLETVQMGLNVLGEKPEKHFSEEKTGFVTLWDQVEHHG